MSTARETTAELLNNNPALLELGLPEDAVIQADSAQSPTQRPFIVLRWGDQQPGLGNYTRRPMTLWVYDEEGDPTRAERIGNKACEILKSHMQVKTDTGWILEFREMLQGADLFDEIFDALVIPFNGLAVASGV